jgi:hypothetical protein
VPFRAKGITTVLQIEDYEDERNPGMHSPSDTITNLNLDYLLEQIRLTVAIAARLSELEPTE